MSKQLPTLALSKQFDDKVDAAKENAKVVSQAQTVDEPLPLLTAGDKS